MIVIDPRRTEAADLADLHLALRPGADAFLLGALLALIVARGGQDDAFLAARTTGWDEVRSEEHTSELQSLMRISYAVFCLKKKNKRKQQQTKDNPQTTDNY